MYTEFDISIIDGPTRRTLKTHTIGDRRYVGVKAGDTFGIIVRNHTDSRMGVCVSVGGVDIATAEPATLLEGGRFIIDPRAGAEFRTWRQSLNGGAALVFTEQALAVSSFRVSPDLNLPPNLISVAAWAETPRRPLYEPTYRSTRAAQSDLESQVHLCSHEKGGGITRGLGVGAGEYQEQRFETTSALYQPRSLGIKSLWFMPWEELLQELERIAPPQIPTGFLNAPTPGFANLDGIPRVGASHVSPRPARFDRFA